MSFKIYHTIPSKCIFKPKCSTKEAARCRLFFTYENVSVKMKPFLVSLIFFQSIFSLWFSVFVDLCMHISDHMFNSVFIERFDLWFTFLNLWKSLATKSNFHGIYEIICCFKVIYHHNIRQIIAEWSAHVEC